MTEQSEREPHDGEHPDDGVRVTDRRRIDPETGEVRAPAGDSADAQPADDPEQDVLDAAAQAVAAEGARLSEAAKRLAADAVTELTADLQRLAAEYKNYRDRTQREIAEARARGRAEVVNELIGTLDDLDRAAEHGEMQGPVKALADNLTAALGRLGVERYGAPGDAFDPLIHEALTHNADQGLDAPQVQAVYQAGYRMGDRIVRPARVGVVE